MQRVLKTIGLLAAGLLAIGAAPPPELSKPGGKVDVLAKTRRTGPSVDLNEIRLSVFGGFDGERLSKTALRPLRRLDGMQLYAHAKSDHLYIDRDADGRPDACALYNPNTGIVSADFGCDGGGDQILANLRPPPPVRSSEDLARRLNGKGPR
ncbi:hypothetical protein B7G68_20200 [Caulobacter segnis]|uniref:Uncharacterized protein n=2 Tax=Caulobacter segnis TaxID=88688 RepID=D5VPF1_CAUST|nr:hypothetical protein [Caulobacter segnis]ADG12374.1 hypothetical protein Cseg_3956 [Caulobacter segnis ATCC 21756]AVQ03961.1 hypothetical protein B7G68_20200 [Caulobacter segnis]